MCRPNLRIFWTQQETVYLVWWLTRTNCKTEILSFTGVHSRTFPISSLHHQSSGCFRYSWFYYVCWQNEFVLLKQGHKYCFSQSKQWITQKSMNCLYLRNSHFMWKKYSFSDKLSKKDDIPLPLQKLNINNHETAWTESIKFFGVLVDVNLSWTTHMKYIKNKISKNSSVLFKARPFLNKKVIITLLLVLSYINYGSISWEST